MLHKLLTSALPVILLQYAMLLLLLLFLYRVIRLVYIDFYRPDAAVKPAARPHSAKLKVLNRGFLTSGESEIAVGETLNIGRSEINELVITETTVSAEHACIAYGPDGYLLSDLQSTNGTLHNNCRLEGDARLNPGDTITIGNTIFQFEE
ncbi:MAG: FHA domain-containing protein [Sporomusaceae bacterium]|nr:FHA domain-containing protein [Sporomusaceae bacterium]